MEKCPDVRLWRGNASLNHGGAASAFGLEALTKSLGQLSAVFACAADDITVARFVISCKNGAEAGIIFCEGVYGISQGDTVQITCK